MSAFEQHSREVRRLLAFTACFGALAAGSYMVPGTEAVRPWAVGEPVPLVHLALGERRVVETSPGVLVSVPSSGAADPALAYSPVDTGDDPLTVAQVPELPSKEVLLDGEEDEEDEGAPPAAAAPVAEPAPQALAMALPPAADLEEPDGVPVRRRGVVEKPGEGELPDRAPARGTPLEVPEGALDRYFSALAAAEAGEPGRIARVLHFGDSTIAADGITKTVRRRLQGRFGDGGPGFLAVQVDRRWAMRPDVRRDAEGSWKTRTITFGGAGNAYYGLAGTVSTARGASTSILAGRKVEEERQPLHRVDVFFQVQPDGGTLSVAPEGGGGFSVGTAAGASGDVFRSLDLNGARSITVATGDDGPVTLYGVALETEGPGVTWETLGVAGAGSGSFFRQGDNHLARQVGRRDPDLVVWQIGGNEVGLPVLSAGDGTQYKERYKKAISKALAGAPQASCLVVTPLDQAERYRNQVRSKPNLDRMIRLQRDAAQELGCAFWDARAAMGGDGAFGRWLGHEPKLAWSDLEHLTGRGLALVGNSLADAIEHAYADWKSDNPGMVASSPAVAEADEAGI